MTNPQDPSIYRVGDLVIGSTDPSKSVYSSSGAKLNDNGVSIYGSSEDLQSQYKDIVRSATSSGGKRIPLDLDNSKKPAKTTKTKSKKTSQTVPRYDESMERLWEFPKEPIVEPKQAPKLYTVQFENDFGKIKAKVEHVVEHEQAYMLVFTDEDSVVFEPKVGELLLLHTENGSEAVYYPGVTFNSPENSKKLMILFKVPEINQE
jgi:hypothetical protein